MRVLMSSKTRKNCFLKWDQKLYAKVLMFGCFILFYVIFNTATVRRILPKIKAFARKKNQRLPQHWPLVFVVVFLPISFPLEAKHTKNLLLWKSLIDFLQKNYSWRLSPWPKQQQQHPLSVWRFWAYSVFFWIKEISIKKIWKKTLKFFLPLGRNNVIHRG